jgi:hypothetical protein
MASAVFQYQCVIPAAAGEGLREILARIAASGQGSMLAVLKRFGEQTSGRLALVSAPRRDVGAEFSQTGDRKRLAVLHTNALSVISLATLLATNSRRMGKDR